MALIPCKRIEEKNVFLIEWMYKIDIGPMYICKIEYNQKGSKKECTRKENCTRKIIQTWKGL